MSVIVIVQHSFITFLQYDSLTTSLNYDMTLLFPSTALHSFRQSICYPPSENTSVCADLNRVRFNYLLFFLSTVLSVQPYLCYRLVLENKRTVLPFYSEVLHVIFLFPDI